MRERFGANVVLKLPKKVSIYYFAGLSVALVSGCALVVLSYTWPDVSEATASIMRGLGTSITAGALVAAFAFAGTLVTQSLQEDEALLKTIRDIGIVEYFNKRYLPDEYEQYSRDARQFDLLGYGLGRFRNDMKNELENWVSSKRMRILVINPSSAVTLQRDREENDRVGKISREASEITTDIIDIMHRKGIREPILKWYTAIPTVNIMRMDSVMYIGPYFVGKTSGASITLKLEQNTTLFTLFERHFDDIWRNHDLSVDPSFVEQFPQLLKLRRKYTELRMWFVVGGTCAGKTTALEVGKELRCAVVEWSDVLREYFAGEGLPLKEYEVRKTIRERGVHFFPHRVMKALIDGYVTLGDKCQGFVVSGARNIRELAYLSTFFNRQLTKIITILAADETRRQRYSERERADVPLSYFLGEDDTRIVRDLQEEAMGDMLVQNISTIINDGIELTDFREQVRNALRQY